MNSNQSKPDDLESAISSTRRPRRRFRDIANLAIQNKFHAELKRKLCEGVDHYALEKHRIPLSEIKRIKKKKVREYYEAQNDRLNDWLEVDSLVMSMAEDVLDSMNPVDTDGDGVAEEGGKLMSTRGDIWELLPEDEREKRSQGERRAKWAINVCILFMPCEKFCVGTRKLPQPPSPWVNPFFFFSRAIALTQISAVFNVYGSTVDILG